MNKIISKEEEKKLVELLALTPFPEVTFTFQELLGFFYGIAITPDVIEPDEWIPIIFDEEMPEYESEDQAREMTGVLLSVLDKFITAFRGGQLFFPFDMEKITEKEFGSVLEWTSGFEEALSLRPECWEEHEDVTGEEHDNLVNSLIVIEGITYPEEVTDMFDHIPEIELKSIGINLADDEVDRVFQIQFFLLQALELSVETIQSHGKALDEARRRELRSSDSPFPVRSSKAMRNKECPCGSGKNYISCCGRVEIKSVSQAAKGGESGKIIHVDFGKKSKKKGNIQKISPFPKKANLCYQLEITLAHTDPEVLRRIQVTNDMALDEFHRLIQYVMGWQDTHMHQFLAGQSFYGPKLGDGLGEDSILDESQFVLQDIEKELLQGIIYTYDFGDDWEHVIILEKVIPISEGVAHPIVLEAKRACPPEDIGGPPGYSEFLEKLADPDHADSSGMDMYIGLEDFDPDSYNIDAINKFLQAVYGKTD